MQYNVNPRLIPALLAIAFSGAASASGFQLLGEQSASLLGNAGAGSAAVTENASVIFYNPAGMTQLQDREVSFGGTFVKTNFEFNNNNSVIPGVLGAAGDGGNGGNLGFVPNAYMSLALNKDWYVGLGIGAPFGLKTDYDQPWKGGAQSDKFDLKTININPSIAWRATEWMSLGAGVSWQKVDAQYVRAAAALPTNLAARPPVISSGYAGSTVTLDLDDSAWGWNVGALFNIGTATKVGVSYRSTIKYETTGNIGIGGDGTPVTAATAAGLVASGRASNAAASIKMPDTFILSATHQLNNQWELLGDISWTGWSSIPKVDIMRTSGPLNGQVAQVLDTEFRDAWRFAVGANYKIDDAWKIRMGMAYDQTPVKGASTRLTSLPDNDRIWFSAGFQWKPSKTSAIDVGAAYLYLQDADISNNQLAQGRGWVKGSYDDSAWLLGAQYSMSF